MAHQQDLDRNFTDFSEASVYYRPVKSDTKLKEPSKQPIDTPSELLDVEELIQQIKSDKLDYPTPLDQSGMLELSSDRVSKIVEAEDISDDWVTDLLGLFCGSLEGRQRAENKYAMLVYFENGFLLAHVREQTGMSINKEEGENSIELIRRFLDIDNILSAALFEGGQHGIEFSHFTDSGSESFREFLGVNEYRLNYRRKHIQILTYYRGRREYECKFEFTTDEFRDKWLRDNAIKLKGDKLSFAEDSEIDHSHEVKEVRWGKDRYTSLQQFKSEFKQDSLNLNIERDKYDDLMSYPDETGSSLSVFDHPALDKKREVEVDLGDKKEVKKKGTTPDSLHVFYANDHIDLHSSFASDVFHDLMSGQDLRIYHPSQPAAANALEISNLTLLNVPENEVSEDRIRFFEETYQHARSRSGEAVSKMLINSMLHVLTLEVSGALRSALQQMIQIYSGHPPDGSKFSTKENEGPNLVEYKSRAHLENGDQVEKICEVIKTEKRKQNDRKVIIWGFTEGNRQIEAFSSQSWGDDRISHIESSVEEKLGDESIDFDGFMLQPVDLDGSSGKKIITGILF